MFRMIPRVGQDTGISKKSKSVFIYLNIQSAMRLVPYIDELPIPEAPETFTNESDDGDIAFCGE